MIFTIARGTRLIEAIRYMYKARLCLIEVIQVRTPYLVPSSTPYLTSSTLLLTQHYLGRSRLGSISEDHIMSGAIKSEDYGKQ
jgi:hypothetical protein